MKKIYLNRSLIFSWTIIFTLFNNFILVAQPKIKFDLLEYTMNPVKRGELAELKIPFKNIGNEPLFINALKASVPACSKPQNLIYPNETDSITVKIPTQFIGKSEHNITVETNSIDSIIILKVNLEVLDNLKDEIDTGCKESVHKYKSELKQDSFLKILKKKEDGKAEFTSDGFSNPDFLECSFVETIHKSLKNKKGKKTSYIFRTIEYRFGNQKLYFKIVNFYDQNGDISNNLNIDYYNNSKTLFISKTKETCRIDKRGNIVSTFNSDSYDIYKKEDSIFAKLNSALPKLQSMRNEIRKIIGKSDLVKPYEKYSVKEWKTLNKISDYLKKEINTKTNLYYRGMDKDILALITEDGKYYEYSLINKRVEYIEHGYYNKMN